MIRLIAIDMDGTLLGSDHLLSNENIKAIRLAQSKGIEILITTGRNYLDARIPIESAQLHLLYSCLNGGEFRDESGNILFSKFINQSHTMKIVDILEKENVSYDLFINDYLYTRNIKDQIAMYINFHKLTKSDFEQIQKEMHKRIDNGLIVEVDSYEGLLAEFGHNVYKILGISTDEKKLLKAKKQLESISGITISSSGVGNLEITDNSAQKGISLEYYAEVKGISMNDVMVIGDNFNDISMMKRAGFSVAMENAPNEVKKECMTTTTSNDENGVAFIINKVLSNQFNSRFI